MIRAPEARALFSEFEEYIRGRTGNGESVQAKKYFRLNPATGRFIYACRLLHIRRGRETFETLFLKLYATAVSRTLLSWHLKALNVSQARSAIFFIKEKRE